MSLSKLKGWDRTIGMLHFALAFLVTCQLLIALNMKHFGLFTWHRNVGFCIAIVIFLHWVYIRYNRLGEHFFPYTARGMKAVFGELISLPIGKLPRGGKRLGLPGLIHGLGLLTISMMAATGIIIYILYSLGLPHYYIKLIHKFFAELLWIYWFGHVGMALIHHLFEKRKSK